MADPLERLHDRTALDNIEKALRQACEQTRDKTLEGAIRVCTIIAMKQGNATQCVQELMKLRTMAKNLALQEKRGPKLAP